MKGNYLQYCVAFCPGGFLASGACRGLQTDFLDKDAMEGLGCFASPNPTKSEAHSLDVFKELHNKTLGSLLSWLFPLIQENRTDS